MPPLIWEFVPWVLGGVGAALVAVAAVLGRGGGRRCPGPPAPWWRRVPLLAWMTARPCGYDLSGLPTAADGSVACPECGRRVGSAGETLESCWRRGVVRLGVAILMAGLGLRGVVYARSGLWARHVPTTVLVAWERIPFSWRPACCRRQMARRVFADKVAGWQARMLIPALVADLRDDPYRYNAERAMMLLEHLGGTAVEPLQGALRSPDWQQRQLAAHLLRERPGYKPTDDLLRVTVEGLKDDALPCGRPRPGQAYGPETLVFNAREGVEYLLRDPARAEPFIEAALDSGDGQARLLAAKIAGLCGMRLLVAKAAPVLIDSLRGTTYPVHTIEAAAALAGFGPPVVAWLLPMQFASDQGQRDQCQVVLYNLGLAPPDVTRRLARIGLHRIQDVTSYGWFNEVTTRSEFCGLGWRWPPRAITDTAH